MLDSRRVLVGCTGAKDAGILYAQDKCPIMNQRCCDPIKNSQKNRSPIIVCHFDTLIIVETMTGMFTMSETRVIFSKHFRSRVMTSCRYKGSG